MRHDKVLEGRLPIGAVAQGEEALILDAADNPLRPARWARSFYAAAISPPAIGAIRN